MSASDEQMLKALGQRARARTEEAARIEATLRPATRASVDAVMAALEPERAFAAASSDTDRAHGAAGRPRRGFERRGAWIGGGASLAAAAGVMLFLSFGAGRGGSTLGPYVVSVSGHVEIARAAHDGTFAALEARP